MTNSIVFASNNSGKILELQTLLQDFNVIPQATLGVSEIAETAFTFIENALLKARHACEITGLPAIADDSGLQVDALNGAPGIYSARYAGAKASSQDNINKLLTELATITSDKRKARFYCVLVFLRHAKDPTPLICEGTWDGLILSQPLGTSGFGYDPIFWDPIKKTSAAQLSLAEKNACSHRGHALKLLVNHLQNNYLCQP